MKKEHTIESIIPYLVMGIGIAILIALIIVFFYIFVWGLVIGVVLWGFKVLKERFFSKEESPGERIIEGTTVKKKTSREKK